MSKITLTNLNNLQNENTAVNAINTNNAVIIAAMDNTLSRDGTQPNTMLSDLDMNNHQIFNLPAPSTIHSPARLIDVVSNPSIVIPGTGTSGHLVPYLDGNNTWSGTNNFTQPVTFPWRPTGAGAITTRTLAQRMNDFAFSVKDFGAIGDGVNDDTSAIAAADAAAFTAGKSVYLPAGSYKVSSVLTPSAGAHWFGEGYWKSRLVTNSTTGNVISISNGFVSIDGIGFFTSVTRTAGAYVTISSVGFKLADFYMDATFQGISLTHPTAIADILIENGTIIAGSNNSIGIRCSGGVAVVFKNIILSFDGVHKAFSHIYIEHGGDYSFTDIQCIAGQTGMTITAASGQAVNVVRCTHCWFDTSVSNGLVISQSGTGTVSNCDFVQCWASSTTAGNGVLILSTGSGNISAITMDCWYAIANSATAFSLNGSTIKAVSITNSVITNCASAFGLSGACSNIRMLDNYMTVVTNGFITDASAISNVLFKDNTFDGVSNPVSDGMTGTGNRIESNIGYNPIGISNLSPGISPWTYTAGHTPETIVFSATTGITSANLNGGLSAITVGAGALVNCNVPLAPNQSVTITYTGTLTARSLKQ